MVKRKRKKPPKYPDHTGVTRRAEAYECIDGNWTHYPVAFCKYRKGVLTKGLMKTHCCDVRGCKCLDTDMEFD